MPESTQTAADGGHALRGGNAPAVYERPPAPAPTAIDPVIERLISDSSIDLERVKTVLALRREMEDDAARKAFNFAMAGCKAEIPQVVKTGKNTENNSRYATLDKMGEAIDRIIAKHGFSTSFHPAPCAKEGFLKVVCHVAHIGGHERIFEAEIPTDAAGIKGSVNKTPIHAWKSTMTYGRRVLTEMIFDVKSTNDDDGNAAGGRKAPEFITAEQAAIVTELVAKTGSNIDALLKFYRAECIPEIRASDFDRLIKQLEQKIEAAKAKIFADAQTQRPA